MALESQLSLPWGHKSTHYDWLQAIPASDQNGFLMEKSLHFYPFLEWTLPNLQSQTNWLSHKTSLGAPLWILRIPTLPIPAISCEATPSTELSHSVAVRWQANVPGHTPRLAQPWGSCANGCCEGLEMGGSLPSVLYLKIIQFVSSQSWVSKVHPDSPVNYFQNMIEFCRSALEVKLLTTFREMLK